VWSSSRPGRFYPRERPGTHCTGGWVGPGAGLDRCGKSRLTGIRSPDLPARSESLYRLRYPAANYLTRQFKNYLITAKISKTPWMVLFMFSLLNGALAVCYILYYTVLGWSNIVHFRSTAGSPRGLLGDNLSASYRRKEVQCTLYRSRHLNQNFHRYEAQVQRIGFVSLVTKIIIRKLSAFSHIQLLFLVCKQQNGLGGSSSRFLIDLKECHPRCVDQNYSRSMIKA
jgi:hypothetical protein